MVRKKIFHYPLFPNNKEILAIPNHIDIAENLYQHLSSCSSWNFTNTINEDQTKNI